MLLAPSSYFPASNTLFLAFEMVNPKCKITIWNTTFFGLWNDQKVKQNILERMQEASWSLEHKEVTIQGRYVDWPMLLRSYLILAPPTFFVIYFDKKIPLMKTSLCDSSPQCFVVTPHFFYNPPFNWRVDFQNTWSNCGYESRRFF